MSRVHHLRVGCDSLGELLRVARECGTTRIHWNRRSEPALAARDQHIKTALRAAGLRAWQRGATGYPIVDAGLRERWHMGWMHNRVRMIAAAFLVKDLRLPWSEGARWFWDTLVDADLASNTPGWQWAAGCGADAAPYFGIFNPITQGTKFDPEGTYIRRWVPELARLPKRVSIGLGGRHGCYVLPEQTLAPVTRNGFAITKPRAARRLRHWRRSKASYGHCFYIQIG